MQIVNVWKDIKKIYKQGFVKNVYIIKKNVY